jgi:CheY-like chemotaxis protein
LLDRLDGELNPEQDKQVRIIHDVAESLTAYINDLLDLARTDAGRETVHVSRFHPDGMLKALRRILQPLVPSGVALRFEIEPDLPPITTDDQKLSQILRNLISNAIKFTEHGFIAVRAHRGAADQIVFEIEDSGIGIAPEHHALIFREFSQIECAVQPRMRGSGLGLPLSLRLAELLGGTLTFASRPGVGSTFRLVLPIDYAGDAGVAAQRPSGPAVVPASSTPGQPRILVIDDDLASRYVLKHWLGDRYLIDVAASGQEGLRLAATRPDAIFLDVVMPDLTGFEVIEKLKAADATREIPVIVYTALTLGADDRARLGAAAAIVHKSMSSQVGDRAAIEDALVKAGVAATGEDRHG